MKVLTTVNNYYMDKKKNDDQIHLFLGICLISAMLLIKFLSEIINDADKLDNQEQ